jgi:hypothetical protein
MFSPGTPVKIDMLLSRPNMFVTQVPVRRVYGTVIGPVTYEPSMTMVRINGEATRVLTEYLTAVEN